MKGCEGLGKILSANEDEDIWKGLQYFRDHQHSKDIYANMVQDKEMDPLGKEFFGLIA